VAGEPVFVDWLTAPMTVLRILIFSLKSDTVYWMDGDVGWGADCDGTQSEIHGATTWAGRAGTSAWLGLTHYHCWRDGKVKVLGGDCCQMCWVG
jgi:hypothetical protein